MEIYKKPGSKERLFEMFKGVVKEEINPVINHVFEALDKLKSGSLNVGRAVMQTKNEESFVDLNAQDGNNKYTFTFKIDGQEGDQDGVFDIQDVILQRFHFENLENGNVIDMEENDLTDVNKRFGGELYDTIEKYIDVDVAPGEEMEELGEELEFEPMKKIDKKPESDPYGGARQEYQDGMGYGDEKPVNPKLRVDAPELKKFVKEEMPVDDNTAVISINGYPWYLRKADSTHLYMANNAEALNTGAAWASHIGEHRFKPYYDDIRVWLKGGESPDGKEYTDEMTIGERSEPEEREYEGEELLKKRFGTLQSDLEFAKLAKSYENLMKIKHDEIRSKDSVQKALSALRDLVTDYLREIKGLNVSAEDVQNFFANMVGKYGNIVSEEKKMEDDPCWDDYEMVGMKEKDGKEVPNCVPKNEGEEEEPVDAPSLDPEDKDEDGDMIPGGKADDEDVVKFDPEQILKGMDVEMEHTDDPKVALEIAMDHLEEFGDYYTRLEKMEKDAEADVGGEKPDPFRDKEGKPIPTVDPPGLGGPPEGGMPKMPEEGIEGQPEPPETDDERNLIIGWEEEKAKDEELEDELLGFNVETPNASEEMDFASQERNYEDMSAYKRYQELDAKGFNEMSDDEKEEFYKLWVEFGKEHDYE